MRIVLDLQACQSSGSRHRGIGRYSMALTKAMLVSAPQHEFIVLLNALFPDSIPYIQEELHGLLPAHHIVTWHCVGPVDEVRTENTWRNRAAEITREQVLASLRPDIVHIASLFEGSNDDAVTSIGALNSPLPTAVTLYDLIPLVYQSHYLANPLQSDWYHRKIKSLQQAVVLLAISEATRQEAIALLNIAPEKIVTISSAIDTQFTPLAEGGSIPSEWLETFGIRQPFVLYTGGIDWRKNIEGLIRAFAALNDDLRTQFQLVIVCSVQEEVRQRLLNLAFQQGLADHQVILTGFVSDEDLLQMYRACRLFVFPSLHEGFGLPALEAMACGAPVIAANTSSLPEVLNYPAALFDPHSLSSITEKLQYSLSRPDFLLELKTHGLQQAQNFSWQDCAQKTITAFETVHAKKILLKRATQHIYPDSLHKPSMAYLSPLPSVNSGIAQYSAELLPDLARFYDITLIVQQETVDDPYLRANFQIQDAAWFAQHAAQFDRIVYHVGNSPLHLWMYELFAQYPGTVVLHDAYLGDSLAYMEMHKIAHGIWSRALFASHGYLPLIKKRDPAQLNSVIRHYPCSGSLAMQACGMIVHSKYALSVAREFIPEMRENDWVHIPLISRAPAQLERAQARAELGLQEHDFLVCSFGLLGANKLNMELLYAWLSSFLTQDRHCHLVFVGKNDAGEYGQQILDLIQGAQSNTYSNRIKITGFASEVEYRRYLHAADAAVQLRTHSRGETSKAILDCLAYQVPVIVNQNGAMVELPRDVTLILNDGFSKIELVAALEGLKNNANLRQQLAHRGRDYILAHHHPETVAGNYAQAIEGFYRNLPQSLLRHSLQKLACIAAPAPRRIEQQQWAECLASNQQLSGCKRYFVDLTEIIPHISTHPNEWKNTIEHLVQLESKRSIDFIQRRDEQWYCLHNEICQLLDIQSLNEDIESGTSPLLLTVDDQVISARAWGLSPTNWQITSVTALTI
jgi:glycosyltransferase involved in cell wall biosynthesis